MAHIIYIGTSSGGEDVYTNISSFTSSGLASGFTLSSLPTSSGTPPSLNKTGSGNFNYITNSGGYTQSGTQPNTFTGSVTAAGLYSSTDTTLAISSNTQAANTCSPAASVTITGVTTSGPGSHISAGYTSDPASLTGWGSTGGMVFHIWPSAANTAEWEVCNQTAASITYSAITFSIGVE